MSLLNGTPIDITPTESNLNCTSKGIKKEFYMLCFLRPECQDADVHILIILNFWYIELGPHYKCAH